MLFFYSSDKITHDYFNWLLKEKLHFNCFEDDIYYSIKPFEDWDLLPNDEGFKNVIKTVITKDNLKNKLSFTDLKNNNNMIFKIQDGNMTIGDKKIQLKNNNYISSPTNTLFEFITSCIQSYNLSLIKLKNEINNCIAECKKNNQILTKIDNVLLR
jgi:hypothetical protein